MADFECPVCHSEFSMTLVKEVSKGAEDDEITAIVRRFAWLQDRDRMTFAEFRRRYGVAAVSEGWPALSDKALAVALRKAGARPWRSKSERGWDLSHC